MPPAPPLTEGKATFHPGPAFFRPQARPARDLAVLAAAIHRREIGYLRVLDALSGSGIRALRYALEANADWVWANDANPEVTATLQANLAPLGPDRHQVTCDDASQLLARCLGHQDFYDLVDLDAFGSAAPFLGLGLGSVRIGGLLYLTATDGRSLAGHGPEDSLRSYGAFARSHPSCQEQGLRLLLGALWHQAATRGLGIQPLFSYFQGQTYRVMVRLLANSGNSQRHYGFLGYCHACGNYQSLSWRKLAAPCPATLHRAAAEPAIPTQPDAPPGAQPSAPPPEPPVSLEPPVISGPMWLGPLHDRSFLEPMAALARRWDWLPLAQLLELMGQEANFPPYHYPLAELGRRGKMDLPNRDRLIAQLISQGHRASPTHLQANALKTTADLQTCIAAARQL